MVSRLGLLAETELVGGIGIRFRSEFDETLKQNAREKFSKVAGHRNSPVVVRVINTALLVERCYYRRSPGINPELQTLVKDVQ